MFPVARWQVCNAREAITGLIAADELEHDNEAQILRNFFEPEFLNLVKLQ